MFCRAFKKLSNGIHVDKIYSKMTELNLKKSGGSIPAGTYVQEAFFMWHNEG